MQKSQYFKDDPDIVVVLEGGLVRTVYAKEPNKKVMIADFDVSTSGEKKISQDILELAESKYKDNLMFEVY